MIYGYVVSHLQTFICIDYTEFNRRNKGFCSSVFVYNVTYMKLNGCVTVNNAEYRLHDKRRISYLTTVMYRNEPATCQVYNRVYRDRDIISITRRNPHNVFVLAIVLRARSSDENAYAEEFDLRESSAEVTRSQRDPFSFCSFS